MKIELHWAKHKFYCCI